MPSKQKKRVTFNENNKENKPKNNVGTIQISEIKCDINFIVIKITDK